MKKENDHTVVLHKNNRTGIRFDNVAGLNYSGSYLFEFKHFMPIVVLFGWDGGR